MLQSIQHPLFLNTEMAFPHEDKVNPAQVLSHPDFQKSSGFMAGW